MTDLYTDGIDGKERNRSDKPPYDLDDHVADLKRPRASYLNALYGAYDDDIVFERDGNALFTSNRFLTEATRELRVRPLTSAGVHFLYSVVDSGPEPISAAECALAPSAILFRKDQTLLIWALDVSALPENPDLEILRQTFEIPTFEEMIPMPGTNGWALKHVDPDAFWPLEEMVKAYGSSGDVEIIEPTAADAQKTIEPDTSV